MVQARKKEYLMKFGETDRAKKRSWIFELYIQFKYSTVYCGKGRTVVPAELIKDITYVKDRGTWNRWGENRYICLSIASEEGSSFPFLMIIYSKIPMPKVWEFCSLYKYKRMWNKFITFGNKGNYGDHAGGEKVWGKKL